MGTRAGQDCVYLGWKLFVGGVLAGAGTGSGYAPFRRSAPSRIGESDHGNGHSLWTGKSQRRRCVDPERHPHNSCASPLDVLVYFCFCSLSPVQILGATDKAGEHLSSRECKSSPFLLRFSSLPFLTPKIPFPIFFQDRSSPPLHCAYHSSRFFGLFFLVSRSLPLKSLTRGARG